MHVTTSGFAIAAVVIFFVAYALVMTEDLTQLRKSKPVILGAGLIWILTATIGRMTGQGEIVGENLNHALLEYGELFLFLLVAMTYINVLEERGVFEALQSAMVRAGFGLRGVFWLTGFLAFFISPIADNLTTALIMCSVVLAIGKNNDRFVLLSCINIVIAANAGGAFSPFGDITTLMVWQEGVVSFSHFFTLFVPALVNFLIPAIIMHFFVPKVKNLVKVAKVEMKLGARRIIMMFLLTIITAIAFENFLGLPPALGMMTGLGYLMFFSYWLREFRHDHPKNPARDDRFEIFRKVQQAEWDTLLFFYGILIAVQGIATLGYLSLVSQAIYQHMPALLPGFFDQTTQANTLIGMISAIIDNIPVMYAVLTMNPAMSEGQWLLVTLTAGIGGSLLSIGSAAGVAVMGKAQGQYTFIGHLKWTWLIALGYFGAIITHLWLNSSLL